MCDLRVLLKKVLFLEIVPNNAMQWQFQKNINYIIKKAKL
jgi:hypothetical protein